ncbi:MULTISPECIES: RNA ligase family protein [Leisingera]|uniref:RNA ligase family protein n=1 Tax=Leisingera TaxID=191028 RepID=UPI0004046127
MGEYLYARHAIAYAALPSYFLGFAWILDGMVQSWDQTLERFAELGISSVPVLYRGKVSPQLIDQTIARLDLETQEGLVIRAACGFAEADMSRLLAKYVRAGHVQTDVHWMNAQIIKNALA